MISEILRRSEDDSIVNSLQNNEKGVSPVIGVILMVAVTVALVALVTVVVFDIGSDVNESPDATVQLEADSGEVIATVLRNENVESFKLQAPDGSTQDISGSVGSSKSSAKGSGSYNIIAVMSDGSEEVLTSKDFESISNVLFKLSEFGYTGSSYSASEPETTLGLSFNDDGSKMYVVGSLNQNISSYSLSTNYDISTSSHITNFSVSGEADSSPSDIKFNDDGTKMFVIGSSTTDVFSYSLSTPYNIGSASYTGNSFDVSSEDSTPNGLDFNSDGTKMYIVGNDNDSIFSYSLGSQYDLTSTSYTGNSLDVSSETTTPTGVTTGDSGSKIFISERSNGKVVSYKMSTTFDLNSASFNDDKDVSSETGFPEVVVFNGEGSKMYVIDGAFDNIYSYST